MNIAFDAKRAYNNGTGLGHYSRTLIQSLATYYPEHNYYLCTPKLTDRFKTDDLHNVFPITPKQFPSTLFKSAWRSSWVKKDLQRLNIQLYHGLSHEIPLGIQQTGIQSVVTIHDLIHERYPAQYNPIDVKIYTKKFSYACKHADKVIAISKQTKDDIIQFYGIAADKIEICYQSCNEAFTQTASEAEKQRVKAAYHLPERFFLYVGSIIERKNLLTVCKALHSIKHLNIPLVVIGSGDKYQQTVKDYIKQQNLENLVIFLSETAAAKNSAAFRSAADFPAIYQQAVCMIYPSIFEGFGIPVLEALWSRLPVITSNVSCLPETGGDAALYVDPYNTEQMADAMQTLLFEEDTRSNMIEKGWQHAQHFTRKQCAAAVMQVYHSLV